MDSETYFGDQGMTADVCERRREKPPPQQLTECDWRFFYPSEQVSVDEHVLRHALQRHLLFLIGVGSHLDCRAAITRGGTRTLARHQKTGEAD
jgi:hypothetical protein